MEALKPDKNIAVFGGSFNPPHLAHPYLCLSVLQTHDIDKIMVLPAVGHPEKDDLVDIQHRAEMCRIAFEPLSDVYVSVLEAELPSPNYTTQTLQWLQDNREYENLYYILGADLAEDIPSWDNAEGLTDLCQLIVVPRQGHPIVDPPPELGDYLEAELGFELPELSSTAVRRRLQQGRSASVFLDNAVEEYISHYELYT